LFRYMPVCVLIYCVKLDLGFVNGDWFGGSWKKFGD